MVSGASSWRAGLATPLPRISRDELGSVRGSLVTWRYIEVRDRDGPLWRRFIGLWLRRHLLLRMALRDVRQRYAGASLGIWWAIINPLVFVCAYTLLFTVIFRARLTPGSPPTEYALYVVSGLLPWIAFSEVATKATQTVSEHRNLIKYTMFPAELLPLTGLFGAMLSQIAGLTLVVVVSALARGGMLVDFFWIVPALLLEVVFLAGVAWTLAAVGAVLRDVRELVPIVLTTGMFFTPIFYEAESLPTVVQTFISINPLVPLLRVFRAAIVGIAFRPVELGWFALVAITFALVGFTAFERVRGELADTL